MRYTDRKVISENMARPKFDDKRTRFKVLAERRTNIILDALRTLGHCHYKNLYSYKTEEIERIFQAIEEELKRTKAKFDIKVKRKFKF